MAKATFTSEIRRWFTDEWMEESEAIEKTASIRYLTPTDEGYALQLLVGNRKHEVEVLIEPPGAPGRCTCKTYLQDGLCAHIYVAAVLLDGERSVDNVPARATREARTRKRLQRLRGRVLRRSATAWDLVESGSSRLCFVIERAETHDDDGVRVHVKQRTIKADGEWSSGKHVDLDHFDFEDIPSEVDQRLLGLLGYGAGRVGMGSRDWRLSREEHRLSEMQAAEVLPAMARAERLEFRDSRPGAVAAALLMDEGDPYQVRLRGELSDPETKPVLRVEFDLVRDDLEVAPREVRAVLPGGFAVVGQELVRVEPSEALGLLRELVVFGPMVVGEAALPAFRDVVSGLPPDVWRASTELGDAAPEKEADDSGNDDDRGDARADAPSEVQTGPIPELHVTVEGRRSSQARLECDIFFRYGDGLMARPDSRVLTLEDPKTGVATRRQFKAEAARLREYLEVGGRRSKTHRELGEDGNISRKTFGSLVRDLSGRGWRILADKKEIHGEGQTSIRVRSGVDWFDVEGGMDFGDQTASFPELLAAAREGRTTIELGDGSTGMLPEAWLQRWGLLGIGEETRDGMRFQRNQGWVLDALLAQRDEAQREEAAGELDADFQAYRERLRGFRRVRPRKEPAGFQGELRPYQRDALGWFRFLSELGLGGCLADDMGLGKTVQVLALLEARRARRLGKGEARRPSIVVAPRSLVFNWIQEAERFAPRLAVLDFTGPGRQKRLADAKRVDLLVTTYGSLRKDAPGLMETRFDYAILDEATAIKNRHSQSAKAARLLVADHRLALSGTPVENHLHELWSLFEFLNPGMLGRSSAFRQFADAPAAGSLGDSGGEAASRGTDAVQIGRAIRPFFLRRTKDEVLTDLPDKSEQILHVELSKKDRKRYDELKAHFRQELLGGDPGDDVDKLNVLTALLRLRQAACHPGLIDPKLAGEDSAKLEMLLPRLEELASEGHKVLVFSQFTSLLAILKSRLDRLGVAYEYLDGKTAKRKDRVKSFQSNPKIPLFLISLKAGGHGLNLTAADYVFLLDPWWNPAIESQAVDRAHRIGQTRSVFACRLIAKDTVEERVMELQAEKRQLADDLFQGGKGLLRELSRADLDALLT